MRQLLLVTIALVFTGCASILSGSKQTINVDSNVEGANVYINGLKVGTTPYTGQIERAQEATLKISKKGYKSKTLSLNVEIESVFWVNILSGGPFGSTTDYASGSMWKVAPNTYNIDLERLSPGKK